MQQGFVPEIDILKELLGDKFHPDTTRHQEKKLCDGFYKTSKTKELLDRITYDYYRHQVLYPVTFTHRGDAIPVLLWVTQNDVFVIIFCSDTGKVMHITHWSNMNSLLSNYSNYGNSSFSIPNPFKSTMADQVDGFTITYNNGQISNITIGSNLD